MNASPPQWTQRPCATSGHDTSQPLVGSPSALERPVVVVSFDDSAACLGGIDTQEDSWDWYILYLQSGPQKPVISRVVTPLTGVK